MKNSPTRRTALYRARLNRFKSAVAVAREIGCSEVTIHALESGKRDPSPALARKIARYYQKPPAALFGRPRYPQWKKSQKPKSRPVGQKE